MISIIQMNIYIKLPRPNGRHLARALYALKLYQRYWRTVRIVGLSLPERILSRFSMNTSMRLFTRLVRSLILQGGRTKRTRGTMERGYEDTRGGCLPERRTLKISYSSRDRGPR